MSAAKDFLELATELWRAEVIEWENEGDLFQAAHTRYLLAKAKHERAIEELSGILDGIVLHNDECFDVEPYRKLWREVNRE